MNSKLKNTLSAVAILALAVAGGVATAQFSGKIAMKRGSFNMTPGQQNQAGAGEIKEPSQDSNGQTLAAEGLRAGQKADKDPYIVSNADWSSWAFMKVCIPKFEDGNDALILENVSSNQVLLSDNTSDPKIHTLIYGYKNRLEGGNSSKNEADRAKTDSLFTAFRVSDDAVSETFVGSLDVYGSLVQSESEDVKAAFKDAHFDKNTYKNVWKISYELDGGQFANSDKVRYLYTEKDYGYVPPKPTKDGFKFTAWSPTEIADGTTGDTVFTAGWKANTLRIRFQTNGANRLTDSTHREFDSSSNVIHEINDGEWNKPFYKAHPEYGLSDQSWLEKDGYHSSIGNNWRIKNNNGIADPTVDMTGYTGADVASFLGVLDEFKKDDITVDLIPEWTANTYSVKYNANAPTGFTASGTMANTSVTYDKAKALTNNAFTVPNYSFVSWNTKQDGTGTKYENGASIKNLTTKNGDTINLYAQWKADTLGSITYTLNGGALSGQKTSQTVESYGYKPPVPTKANNTFASWSPASLPVNSKGDVNFTANWNVHHYKVHFDPNGGDGTMTDVTLAYDDTVTLPLCKFTKSDSTFAGWSLTKDGDVAYNDSSKVNNVSYETTKGNDGSSVTLYAVWRLKNSTFADGTTVNYKLQKLVGTNTVTKITRASSMKSSLNITDANIISVPRSFHAIYAWYEDSQIMWYCEDQNVYLSANAASTFAGFSKATSIALDGIHTDNVTNMSNFFNGDTALKKIDMSYFNTKNVTLSRDVFTGCSALEEVSVGADTTIQRSLPTPSSTIVSGADGYWHTKAGANYTSATLPLGKADTYYANAAIIPASLAPTNTWYKSSTAKSKFTNIVITDKYEISNPDEEWDAAVTADNQVSNNIKCVVSGTVLYIVNTKPQTMTMSLAEDISNMFNGFTSVTNITGLDLLNTSRVTKADSAFKGMTALKRISGLESWNTVNLTTAIGMFANTGSVDTFDFSGWHTPALTNTTSMFEGSKVSSINLSNWTISKLKTTTAMFKSTAANEIILGGWSGTITNANEMFANNTSLRTIYMSEDMSFSSSTGMFTGDTALVGGHGTAFISSSTDAAMAKIDTDVQHGYFTKFSAGTGMINAKLYTGSNVSDSYDKLSEVGKDATPWDYRNGSRLLEVIASNLMIGNSKTITVTVPLGMTIKKNTWTAASEASGIESVSFTTLADQGTGGKYKNEETGTLTIKVLPNASSVHFTTQLMFDETTWNKAYNALLTATDMVHVNLDNQAIIKLNKVRTSVAVGGGKNTGVFTYLAHTANSLYIDDTPQKITDSAVLTLNGIHLDNYYPELIIKTTCQSVDKNGNKFYIAPTNIDVCHNQKPASIKNVDGTEFRTYKNYIRINGSNEVLTADKINYQINDERFVEGAQLCFNMEMSITSIAGEKATYSWAGKYGDPNIKIKIKSKAFNENDLSFQSSNRTVAAESQHGNNVQYDTALVATVFYDGYTDMNNVTMQYDFDTQTSAGTAPSLKIIGGRLPMQYNVSAPVTAIMVDDTGKQYGPYVITPDKATSIARGSRILSTMFEDKAIADGFDAKTNKLYFKQIKYIVKTFYGGKTTSEYWQSQAQASQDSAGTFLGTATKLAKSTFSITYNGNTRSREITTSITNTPEDVSSIGGQALNDNKPVIAGQDFTVDLAIEEQSFPYGTVRHMKRPILYAVLPDGIVVNNGVFSMSRAGTSLRNVKAERTKSITIDGNIFNIQKLDVGEGLDYGYHAYNGQSSNTRQMRLNCSSSPLMNSQTLFWCRSFYVSNGGLNSTASWHGAASDIYDVDNDGNTSEQFGVPKDQLKTFTINAKN